MSTAASDRLACGRDPVEVWDAAAAGSLDDHERSCPHCQAVVAQHAAASEPLRAWRDEPVEVPPALLERVTATVRLSLAGRSRLPLPSPHGPVLVDAGVAATVIRAGVDGGVDGVTARSCRVEPTGAEAGVVVAVSVLAPWGRSLPALAEQVRRVVRATAADRLGMVAGPVHVTVEDLAEQAGPAVRPVVGP